METQITRFYFFGGLIVMAVAFALAAVFSPSTDRLVNAAASLIAIATAALVIERLMEMGWTTVDHLRDSWWPFTEVSTKIKKHVDNFDEYLTPYFRNLAAAVADAPDGKSIKAKKVEIDQAVEAAIAELPKIHAAASKMSDNQKLSFIVDGATEELNKILVKYPEFSRELDVKVNLAADMKDTFTGFLGTFKDNPARRYISVSLGVVFGIAAASVLNFDVFAAASGSDLGDFSVPLTGLAIGMGSNPTHELIKALQKSKQSKS